MKSISRFSILIVLLSLLSSCAQQSTPESLSTPSAVLPSPEKTAYPVPDDFLESSTYPVPGEQATQMPPYMVPGFVTMTPDASLTSIVISEVRHENDVESIYVTNISSATQDISNYMIYSPELDVRKIFPSNLILEPGESFVLYNGANLDSFPVEQQWLDTPILTEALDEVWLTNSAGRILYYFIYYPSISP
jgi:hypothetical protein